MRYAILAVACVGTSLLAACSPEAPSDDSQAGAGGSCVGESCGAQCPSACDDGIACTLDQPVSGAQPCSGSCTHTEITACTAGDGCCPTGCTFALDGDCSSSCGNGTLEGAETCDPPSSCPASCDDADACTTDQLAGSAANCSAACVHTAITVCAGGDGGTVVPNCDESAIDANPNTLAVNVTGATQVIHKELFGVLMEILGRDINGGIYVGTGSAIPNTQGIRNDIIEGFMEAGVGAIQWPGGCAANGYDWQANLNPPNTMGTDLFMEFTKWVGAEPYLVGRPQSTHAQSNRDWIEYVNDNASHPDWHVKYFKVGNEVWGCGGDLGDDVATYETWYNANYNTLNGPVNGKETFLVGATGGIWTINPNTDNWLTTTLSPGHIAEKLDGIEIHDYVYFPDTVPCVGFSENQYYDIVNRANEGQIAPRVRDIKTILDSKDPGGRIKIMEDEWGDWLKELNASDTWFQQGTLMDAISAAEQLHVFMAHADRILMAGLAQPVNVIHSLFLTNSGSGGTDLVKTPTFHVFKLFVAHHSANAKWAPGALTSEDITGNGKTFPVLSSGATVDDEGRVHISLANVDLVDTRSVTVTLDSSEIGYTVESAQVITGPAKDSYNDFGKPETVNAQPLPETNYTICKKKLEVTLPSKSVTMLSLQPIR